MRWVFGSPPEVVDFEEEEVVGYRLLLARGLDVRGWLQGECVLVEHGECVVVVCDGQMVERRGGLCARRAVFEYGDACGPVAREDDG